MRLWVTLRAMIAPPRSICETSQPPKISPLEFVCIGIAIVRITSSPEGAGGGVASLMSRRYARRGCWQARRRWSLRAEVAQQLRGTLGAEVNALSVRRDGDPFSL